MALSLGVRVGLGFAPYIAFATATRAASPFVGLCAAVGVAAIMTLGTLRAGRAPKLLEIGSLALFGGLAAITALTGWGWTFMTLRLAVDAGLFLLIIGSLAFGRPFTLAYAAERVPPEVRDSPRFHRVNRRITLCWAIAFLALVATHAATISGLGPTVLGDILITLAVLAAAVVFSTRYPAYAGRRTAAA